ncbi:MAG: hypothetical protein ACTSX9_02120 [Candidatus Njordarchaeales archaeon]
MSLQGILKGILRKEESFERRCKYLERLLDADIKQLETNILGITKTIELIEYRVRAGDVQEKVVLVEFLRVLSEVSVRSQRLSSVVLDFLISRLKKLADFLIADDYLLSNYIAALRIPLKNETWRVFELIDTLRGIVLTDRFEESRKAVLRTLNDIAWNLPYIISDFKDALPKLLKESPPDIKSLTIHFIARILSRNLYATKSLITELLASDLSLISEILDVATYLPIPLQHKEIAESFFNVIYERYLVSSEPSEQMKLLRELSKIIRINPFPDLQNKFLEIALDKLLKGGAENLDIKANLLEILSSISWHPEVRIDKLVDTLINALHNPLEREEIRGKVIEALMKTIIRYPQFISEAYSALLDAYELCSSAENKTRLIKSLQALLNLVRDRALALRTTTLLLNIMQDVGEEESVRVNASELLTELSKRFPDIIAELSSNILSIFNSLNEWDLRDSLVRIAGEAVKKGFSDEYLVDILVNALSDEWIYSTALDYLVVLAYNKPESLLEKISKLRKFLEVISSVEKEILEEENMEAYYYHIETPKRIFYRILREIVTRTKQALEEILEILIIGSKEETNEIIIRDIAQTIKDIIEIDEEFKEKLNLNELNPLLLDTLKQFGLNIS